MEAVKVSTPFLYLKREHSVQLTNLKSPVCSKKRGFVRGLAGYSSCDGRHLSVDRLSDRHNRSCGTSNSAVRPFAVPLPFISFPNPVQKVCTVYSTWALLASGSRQNNHHLNFAGENSIVGALPSSSDAECKPTGVEGTADNLHNQGFIVSEAQSRTDVGVAFCPPPILADLLRKLCPQRHTLSEEADSSCAPRFNDLVFSKSLNLAVLLSAPRRRLLIATTESLRQKIGAFDESAGEMQGDEWLQLCTQTIRSLTVPVFGAWIAQEASESNRSEDRDSVRDEGGRAEPGGSQLGSIQGGSGRSERGADEELAELHSELLFLLRFTRTRPGSLFKAPTMTRYAPLILEDLVVSVAEAVVALYLDRWLAGAPAEEELPVLMKPTVASTRKLEKFRNEVALRKWLYRRFGSVEAMVEDRIDLWTLSEERLSEGHGEERGGGREAGTISPHPSLSFEWESVASRQAAGGSSDWVPQNAAHSIGKALKLTRIEPQKRSGGLIDAPGFGAVWREWSSGLRRWATGAPGIQQRRTGGGGQREVERLVIGRRSMPARRIKELKALQGGRLAFSLFLEVSDVAGPILRALCQKLGDAISFLLTFFIGRSLGLIYRGIRQSLRLKT